MSANRIRLGYFLDGLVVNWACKVTVLDMIDDHLAVRHMYFLPSSSQQTLMICLSNVAIYSDSRVNKIPNALQGFVCMR